MAINIHPINYSIQKLKLSERNILFHFFGKVDGKRERKLPLLKTFYPMRSLFASYRNEGLNFNETVLISV